MGIKWQKLQVAEPKHDFTYGSIYRAKVPGGWLLAMFWSSGHCGGPCMSFYPDPDHMWNGESIDLSEAEPRSAVAHTA